MTFTGAIGLIIMATIAGGWGAVGDLTTGQWMWVLYLALICSVLAYFCYNRALRVIEAGRAATWVYIEPPVAIIFGALLLGDVVQPGGHDPGRGGRVEPGLLDHLRGEAPGLVDEGAEDVEHEGGARYGQHPATVAVAG
jgi:hypothetical protein